MGNYILNCPTLLEKFDSGLFFRVTYCPTSLNGGLAVMARLKAPGKWFREGVPVVQVMEVFPDDATAEAWFAKCRWPNGMECPACASGNGQERPTAQARGAVHPLHAGGSGVRHIETLTKIANALDAKVADLLY